MTASALLARAAITLNEYFSVTQIDASIIGFMGAMLWWWMPSKRPAAPKPGQPERLERMTDRIDAFVAGLLLAVLINVRIQLTPYAQTFDVAHAPFLHQFQYSMPCTAAIVYLAWLHVIVPLVRGKAKPTADGADDKPKAAAKAAAGGAAVASTGSGAEAGAAKAERSATFDVMDRVVQLWNLFLSAGSFVMLVGLIDALIGYGSQCGWSVVEMIIDSTRARWHGPGFFLIYLFQMSKFIELFDTVLLVAKRKAVSFLHWYHHTTVLLYCWLAVSCTYAPGWWFGTVNCAVHTIMYWYYFRSACGVKLSYDKFITTIQLVQMAIGVAVTGAWTYFYFTVPAAAAGLGPYAQGVTPTVVIASSAIMYASYFVLFFAFYIDRYWRKRAAAAAGKAAAKANGANGASAVPVKVAKPVA